MIRGKRYKIMRKLCDWCNVPDGTVTPKYLMWIAYILFPGLLFAKLAKFDGFDYDHVHDVYTIHGAKYSGELMRGFAHDFNPDDYFRIVERGKHGITIEQTQKPLEND